MRASRRRQVQFHPAVFLLAGCSGVVGEGVFLAVPFGGERAGHSFAATKVFGHGLGALGAQVQVELRIAAGVGVPGHFNAQLRRLGQGCGDSIEFSTIPGKVPLCRI